MSDTLDFLNTSKEASAANSTDIDLEAVAGNLDSLTDTELVSIMEELDLPIQDSAEAARKVISDYIARENGTANVIDITHESAGRANPMVEDETEEVEIDPTIVNTSRLWWQNPFTGNKIPHGQSDVDGKGNVNGKAVYAPAPNPIQRPPVYGDE